MLPVGTWHEPQDIALTAVIPQQSGLTVIWKVSQAMKILCLSAQVGSMDRLKVLTNMLPMIYIMALVVMTLREVVRLLITAVPSMAMSLVVALVTSHTLQVNGTGRLVMWAAIP